jgi:hypothetical protein
MATKTAKAPVSKRTAPTPTTATGAGTTATTKQAVGSAKAKAQAPQAPLFKVGKLQPVRPGTHRAYAQAVAQKLAKEKPKGFTLAEFKAALVAGAEASTIAPPRGGWQGHNMPTWMANPAQQWLIPAK